MTGFTAPAAGGRIAASPRLSGAWWARSCGTALLPGDILAFRAACGGRGRAGIATDSGAAPSLLERS
jgi:hypothetical protein